jgi:hypothetical protein
LNGDDARCALLEGLWDYAGVFPPAELSLEEALDEWGRIRASDDAWLANRLVVRPEHVRLCGSEPIAIVEGAEERQGDEVFREGETKLRCGGARVPAAEEVGAFVRSCRDRGAPFKATAGLHHALPTDGEHGFLNLLAAVVFGDEEEMLATREIALDAASFRADGRSADAARCRDVRRGLLRSIGSCSFAEPVGELRALGIL